MKKIILFIVIVFAIIAVIIPVCTKTVSAPNDTKDTAAADHALLPEGLITPLSEQDPTEADKTPLIVIDPGHGGSDPGCMYENIKESSITLAVSEKLKNALEKAGYRVVLTRTNDSFLELHERVDIAREEKADIFVSIHVNSLENDTVTSGIQTYCSAQACSSNPLLAESIHNNLIKSTGAPDKGCFTDSEFHVCINNRMPACLVEIGFITCSEERSKLLDGNYQTLIAGSICEGIKEFIQSGSQN